MERFQGMRYELRRADSKKKSEEVAYRGTDRQAYLSKWCEALADGDASPGQSLRSRVTVARASVVEFLIQVATEIAELHERGEVHGDIKPSNILAARSGSAVIDAVGLGPGDVSPLVTAGWSPPEQLTRQPLGLSADVFTLGLLFLRTLGGERLGRLIRYQMPDTMEALQVKDPAVYFAPEEQTFVGEGRLKWASVLEKALRAEPKERHQDARALVGDLEEALALERPLGELTFSLPWDGRPVLASSARGAGELAWVIQDRKD